jgi:hypothetical protein
MSEPAKASVDYLQQLNDAVAELVARPATHSLIDDLKQQLPHTAQPFVWATIDLQALTTPLPDNIKSCWIFVLKKETPSGCHYHPNSIQHMVMIEGEGSSLVGARPAEMKLFNDPDSSLTDTWYVIPEGMPHLFLPRATDVVVVSFHTCGDDELEEISLDSGTSRNYETAS